MRYLFLLIILYLCFNFVTLGQEVNIDFEKKPYWVENFDKKGGLDDKLWGSKKEKSGGLVFYTGADEKNVKVKKGKLILTIRKDSASGKYLYTSGRIFTKQYFRYGKFEIKAKLPVTAGVWPALWFKANSGPACVGEIDLG